MIKVLMAVLDKKAGTFIEHFVSNNVIQAARDFEQETIREGSTFNKYPDDFVLMQIANITTEPNPKDGIDWLVDQKEIVIATARDFIKSGKAEHSSENIRNIEKNTLHSV